MTRHLLTAAVLAGLFSLDASAQQVVRHDAGTVSVNAVDVPVGVLLRELGSLGPFSKLRVDPTADSVRVTITLDHVPLHVAIVEVLKKTDVGFVFAGGVEGEPFRLIAEMFEFVETPGGRTVAPAQVAEAVPEDEVERPEVAAEAIREATTNTDRTVAAMTDALSAPSVPAHSTGVVTMPFPDAAGAPITQIVTPGIRSQALPFPAAAVPPSRTPSQAAPQSEPSLQALEETLSPKPQTRP